MAVENFWRNLKHGTLHHLLHPRLDQLIYLIVMEVLPLFEAKKQIFDPDFRKGRAKALTPWQKEFKKSWKTLSSRPLGSRDYQTDISRRTCTCRQPKYNAFLLCKHLVQAVHPPEPAFFHVVRRRVIPFYHHPLLKPKDGSTVDSIEDGSISDGDAVGLAPTRTPQATVSSGALIRGVKRKRAANASHDGSSTRPGTANGAGGSGDQDDPYIISSSPIREDEYEDVSFWKLGICSNLPYFT
jgi:hypothetical protein